jgi:acyl carrier protein
MTKDKIFDKVKEIIAEKIERSDGKISADMIALESRFIEDLGADSLQVLELIMAIEDGFDLDEIPESVIEKIRTVSDAVEYLEGQLA